MKGYSCTNNDTVKKRHFIVEALDLLILTLIVRR